MAQDEDFSRDRLKLLFIRHAESVGNVEKRMQGHADYELTERGRQQAKQLAERLWAKGHPPSQVYSSPLKRAAQTAETLLAAGAGSAGLALDIQYVEELLEFQNGIFKGLTWDEARSQYPALCAEMEASPDWIPAPGAETLQDGRDRAQRFIQQVLAHHANGETLWIVTHGWILQHLIAAMLGCDRTWHVHIQNTAVFEFWLERSRWPIPPTNPNRWNSDLWQIRRFNDITHLKKS
ncbi:MAG: histidine phosphatase family protein [Cyanobacteria bacterium J069]|nr:MAG: histidine phosphatase family protein [Cyanobacteria bacterium J069]